MDPRFDRAHGALAGLIFGWELGGVKPRARTGRPPQASANPFSRCWHRMSRWDYRRSLHS